MKKDTIISSKKLTIWIINLSILGLVLTSFFPLISVPENDAVKEELYFDYKMMKNSDNVEIYSLVDEVNLINLLLWAVIIMGLISFFCITFLTFLTRWYLSLMTITSMVILIFSIFVVLFQYNFITAIVNTDLISLPSIFHAIKYAHFILLFSIILLICSIRYTLTILVDLVKQLIALKSKKVVKKKTKEKPEETPLTPLIDKQISPPNGSIKKKGEMENWLKEEIQNLDKKTEVDPSAQEKEVMKPTPDVQIDIKDEKTTSEDKIQQGPFPPEKSEVKPKESDEPRPAQSFEKALSSAIEKKQSELDQQEKIKPESEEMTEDSEVISKEEESQPVQIEEVKEQEELPLNEKDIITTEIIVKCPQCKHIFATKKEGETTKIKCPKCGKEGIAQ